MAIISGVADKKLEQKIIKNFVVKKANQPWPILTVLRPIKENSKNWREYMKTHKQNYPNQYHNGGGWPFIGGFWIIALIKLGKKELVRSELTQLAKLNQLNEWGFNEWFHGKTGEPMGMTGQSWSAAMYLFAYYVKKTLLK